MKKRKTLWKCSKRIVRNRSLYISILRQLLSRQIYTIYTKIYETMLDETKTTTTPPLIGYCVRV